MQKTEINPDGQLVEPLTRREFEVLALLEEGLTSREIADHLVLSSNTARWHIQHIYGKLGVSNRRQAVIRGRELGLLPPKPDSSSLEGPVHNEKTLKHNLPAQVTRFFGREQEIEKIQRMLVDNRLVTLTGPGGVGKSRLSLKAAEALLQTYPDGIWFVELASLTDPNLVSSQVAAVLGVREKSNRLNVDILVSFLRNKKVLLILDNCEHLLEACANLAYLLLLACPGTTILTSSREPLGIEGEAIFNLPCLHFPKVDEPVDLEKLGGYSAVNLFLDRARLVLPNYQLTTSNCLYLASICQRLDGIPLALELAASRVRMLTAEQISERLDEVFSLLTRGSRIIPHRHQTLRATIDWSYNLLNDQERLLFRRLSVFSGGFSLAAVERICTGNELEMRGVLDLLGSLVSKSLVIADRQSGKDTRYRFLDTVRQYAHELLRESNEFNEMSRNHRDFFLSLVESRNPAWYSIDFQTWREFIQTELDNLRKALEWSLNDLFNVEAAPRFWLALNGYWEDHQQNEKINWLLRCISWCRQQHDNSQVLFAQLLYEGAIEMCFRDGKAALSLAEQSVEIFRGLDNEYKEKYLASLAYLIMIIMDILGDVERIIPLINELEVNHLDPDWYKESPDKITVYLGTKAWIYNQQGHFTQAKEEASYCIQLLGQENLAHTIWPHMVLAEAHLYLREFEQARNYYLKALNLSEEYNPFMKPVLLRYLGLVDYHQGNLDRALEYCREGLSLAQTVPDPNIMAYCIGLCACILAKKGEKITAATLSGAVNALYQRQKRNPWEDSSLDTILPGWRDGSEAEAISNAYEGGKRMSFDQMVELDLS